MLLNWRDSAGQLPPKYKDPIVLIAIIGKDPNNCLQVKGPMSYLLNCLHKEGPNNCLQVKGPSSCLFVLFHGSCSYTHIFIYEYAICIYAHNSYLTFKHSCMDDFHVYNTYIIIAFTYFCRKFGSITAET